MRKISFNQSIKEAIHQSMILDKNVIVYGLGVGSSSNIYGTTSGLKKKFGSHRVFDTPSAESALTAMGTGMSLAGLRPLLIHQRFDFMMYSLDQIVNWISLWSYKSGGKSQLPITIRTVVGKGWGQGPQHSKSLHSWFANIPGLSVVYPSSAFEAKGLLLSSMFSNFPTIFFESRSLHSMTDIVPEKPYFIDPTKAFVRKKGKDLTIIGFGPSVVNAIEVAKKLESRNKINCEIIDLRSLNPIDQITLIKSAKKTKKIVVIENGWPDSGIAVDVISKITENVELKKKPLKFCWPKSFVPTAYPLEKKFYLDNEEIVKKILIEYKK
jgi:acetoin:2,6-dichlorophenolindophenol oxidoreductase subunit beta